MIRRYNFGESLDVFMEQPVWKGEEKKKQSQIQSCHFCVLSQKCDTLKTNTVWYLSRYQTGHSLVSEDVPILVGIEGQFEDAIHNAALDGHLGVLQLLLASVLPNSIRSHGAVQVPQKIFHCCRFVIRCRAPLECWRDKDH